jgi:hypothetical protein
MAQWPHERSLVKDLAGKPFALIGVHLKYDAEDDASIVKKVMVKQQLNWRTFVDRGPIADKWKPAGTPAFYTIDAKGVIRHKWAGAPAAKVIDTALHELIQEAQKDAGKL